MTCVYNWSNMCARVMQVCATVSQQLSRRLAKEKRMEGNGCCGGGGGSDHDDDVSGDAV